MRYSTLLLAALPLVAAAPIDYVTHVALEYVTVTIDEAGRTIAGPAIAAATTPANVVSSAAAATAVPTVDVPASPYVAPAAKAVAAAGADSNSVVAAAAPSAPSSDSTSSSGDGCGCPGDSAAPMSPGINGNPSKSVLDSTNCIRRMYNPSALCLKWSPSLASASQDCANSRSEGPLRAGSTIVSDPSGYGGDPWYQGSKATTAYESSMFTLLCQKSSDPLLNNKCKGNVGEDGCTQGACVGHRDALIDATQQFSYMGAGMNGGWVSTSFSNLMSV